MHSIPFALKRAYLRTLAAMRACALPFGVTPARFDLMYLVHTGTPGAAHQRFLHRELGLSAATVSKMLRRLEELGLVRRRLRWTDRRKKVVRLTPEGRRRIRRIIRRVLRPGHVQQLLETIFFRLRDAPLRFALATLYAELRFMAVHFGDTSTPPYTATCIGDRARLCPWSVQAWLRGHYPEPDSLWARAA